MPTRTPIGILSHFKMESANGGSEIDGWTQIRALQHLGFAPMHFLISTDACDAKGTHSLQRVISWLNENKIQTVIVHYSRHAALCRELRKNGFRVLGRSHNLEFFHVSEKSKHQRTGFAQRLRSTLGAFLQERTFVHNVDQVLEISSGDARWHRRLYGINSSRQKIVLPLVPPKTSRGTQRQNKSDPLRVLFPGSNFSNNVNRAGLDYLMEQVIPHLNSQSWAHLIHLRISGKIDLHLQSELEVRAHNFPGKIFFGYADDPEQLFQNCDVVISPTFLGWGCKLKIVDAISRGIPVIATPQSLRAFLGISESPFMVAENSKQFVDHLEKLLDPQTLNSVAQSQAEFWCNHYQNSLANLAEAVGKFGQK